MYRYIAVIHKEPGSDYGVSFPDFPGCITAGHTIEEAAKMAYDALPFHVRGMREDGEEIPSPSTFENIAGDPEYADAVAFLAIPLPAHSMQMIPVGISMPEHRVHQPGL